MGNKLSTRPLNSTYQLQLNQGNFLDMVRLGNLDIIQYLISEGKVNVDYVDQKTQETALMRGLHHPNVIRWLLIHYADVEHRNKEGLTALRLACRLQAPETGVVTALLAAGGDQDIDNALCDACRNVGQHLHTVCALLGAGATPDKKGLDGNTPVSLAATNNHHQIVEIINAMNYQGHD